MSSPETRVWEVDDRCRVNNFGEWLNGTIVCFAHDDTIAMVVRDGYAVEKAFLTRNLKEAVDEPII